MYFCIVRTVKMKTFKIIPSLALPNFLYRKTDEPLFGMGDFNMKKQKEIWKDVEGYKGLYQVSSLGRFKGLIKSQIMPINKKIKILPEKILTFTLRRGYPFVSLYKDGVGKGASLHRLIAIAFIPNPENKPYVNHKNGIRSDNRVENLEWCTPSENAQHAYDTGLHIPIRGMDKYNAKAVQQLSLSGEFIKIWGSISDANRGVGRTGSSIKSCCKGLQNKAYGFKWKYV